MGNTKVQLCLQTTLEVYKSHGFLLWFLETRCGVRKEFEIKVSFFVALVGGYGSKEAFKGIEELEGEEFRSTLDLDRVGKEQG